MSVRTITKYTLLIVILSVNCSPSNDGDKNNTKKNNEYYNLEGSDILILREVWTYENENNLIGKISDLALDNEGRIFIADNILNTIHAIDEEGLFLNRIGRKGKGPGDFSHLTTINIVEDSLYVLDGMLNRLNIFELESFTLVRTSNTTPKHKNKIKGLGKFFPRQFFIKSDGSILIGLSESIGKENFNKDRKIKYYVVDSYGNFESKDKIFEISDRKFLGNNYPNIASFPFSEKSNIRIFSTGEILEYSTGDFFLVKYSTDGTYIKSFNHHVPKIKLSKDSLLKKYSNEFHKRIINNALLPEYREVIKSVFIDNNDRIWVCTYTKNPNSLKWWLLDNSGELIATILLPKNKNIVLSKDEYLYVIDSYYENTFSKNKMIIQQRE